MIVHSPADRTISPFRRRPLPRLKRHVMLPTGRADLRRGPEGTKLSGNGADICKLKAMTVFAATRKAKAPAGTADAAYDARKEIAKRLKLAKEMCDEKTVNAKDVKSNKGKPAETYALTLRQTLKSAPEDSGSLARRCRGSESDAAYATEKRNATHCPVTPRISA